MHSLAHYQFEAFTFMFILAFLSSRFAFAFHPTLSWIQPGMYKSLSKQANSRATKGMENKTPKVSLRKGDRIEEVGEGMDSRQRGDEDVSHRCGNSVS